MQKKMNAWQSGLLASSALAATLFAASLLWQQGQPQWAFLLAFAAVWILISISWAQSGNRFPRNNRPDTFSPTWNGAWRPHSAGIPSIPSVT